MRKKSKWTRASGWSFDHSSMKSSPEVMQQHLNRVELKDFDEATPENGFFVNKGVWALRGRLQLKSWFRLRAARWVGSGIWWARLLDAALVWRSRHVALERRLFEAGLGTSWLGIFWKWPGSQNAAASKQMQLTQWYFPYTGHTMINCSPC